MNSITTTERMIDEAHSNVAPRGDAGGQLPLDEASVGHRAGLSAILGCTALSLLPGCRSTIADIASNKELSGANHSISKTLEKPSEERSSCTGGGDGFASQAVSQDPHPTYAHLSSTDDEDPTHFWYTHRDTLLGERAVDAWDPLKLINTDRPDFTDVAAVVGDGRVQLETGFLRIDREEGDEKSRVETVPNALVRVGVGDSFEWRIKSRGYTHGEVSNAAGEQGSLEGLADAELGFKWVMKEQENFLPMQSIVVRLGIPVGSDEVSSHELEPGLSYIYNWQVRRWWFFRGSTGIDSFNQPTLSVNHPEQEGKSERDDWIELSQSVSSYFQISKQVGSFVEWFMLQRNGSNDDKTENFHNYGLYLYVTPDVQLDCRAGWRFGDSADEMFWGAGVSVRF